MHSIRTKSTLLNVLLITITIIVLTVVSNVTVANLGHSSSEQALSLLCETGKSNLENYFKSVEQSVNTISSLVDANLDNISDADFNTKLSKHVNESRNTFYEFAKNTNGVLTYYYRIDPEITAETNEKGFWYTNLDGKGFIEHEVTDISDKANECVWFYTPKETGRAIWLPPYVTDTINEYVISYNVPVYRNTKFIGVIGIEISYHTLGQQISNIKIHKSGFAFIVENQSGSIIYHPYIDILGMPIDQRPAIPDGFTEKFKNQEHHIEYTFQGVSKHAYWMELSNGMSIVVAVPTNEVNETWLHLVLIIVIIGIVLVGLSALVTILYTRKLTNHLKN